jgi:hypothetical protein
MTTPCITQLTFTGEEFPKPGRRPLRHPADQFGLGAVLLKGLDSRLRSSRCCRGA